MRQRDYVTYGRIITNNSVALVCDRTIPTERQPFVSEVRANVLRIKGYRVFSAKDPYGRNLGPLNRTK
jgi:hypothetical protein